MRELKKRFLQLCLLAIMFSLLGIASAQELPEILSFTVDTSEIDYDATERGIESANFSWEVINLREGDRLQMHAWVGDDWGLIGEDFEAVKTDTLVIAHPRSFQNPLYRLSVVDANDVRIVEAQLELTYAPITETPEVVWIRSHDFFISQADLLDGAVVPIHWRVINRLPDSNLMFEQILPDGSVINVELPRTEEWLPAYGNGSIAPQYPGEGADVEMQLRLVDRVSGETLATGTGIIPVLDADLPYPQVTSFSITPETAQPGDTITITWEVENGQRIFLTEREFSADEVGMDCRHGWATDNVSEYLPASGSLTYTLPSEDEDITSVRFHLIYDPYYIIDPTCVSYNRGASLNHAPGERTVYSERLLELANNLCLYYLRHKSDAHAL